MRALLALIIVCASLSAQATPPELSDTALKYATQEFSESNLAVALRNDEMIKLRFDGEEPKGTQNYNLALGNHSIKLLLGNYGLGQAKLLIVAESVGGDIAPVVMASKITNLRYTLVRLPIGDWCKNTNFLVTTLLEADGKLYWSSRSAKAVVADCQ